MLLAGIISLGIFAAVCSTFAIYYAYQFHTADRLNESLKIHLDDSQQREREARQKITRLETLLKVEIAHAIAPEAQELNEWITETEAELKRNDA